MGVIHERVSGHNKNRRCGGSLHRRNPLLDPAWDQKNVSPHERHGEGEEKSPERGTALPKGAPDQNRARALSMLALWLHLHRRKHLAVPQ